MTNSIDVHLDLMASLDTGLLHKAFDQDAVARAVEISLSKVLEIHVDAEDGCCAIWKIEEALRVLSIIITAWRDQDHGGDKIALACSAKFALGRNSGVEGSLEYEIFGCFTTSYRELNGSFVEATVTESILEAASKVYLRAAKEMDRRTQVSQQKPQIGQSYAWLRHRRQPDKSEESNSDVKRHSIFKLRKPGDAGYDPFVPKLSKDTPGVVGEIEDEEPANTSPRPQKKVKGNSSPMETGQLKIADMFHTIDFSRSQSSSPSEEGKKGLKRPQQSGSSSPSKRTKGDSGGTFATITARGQGNHGHGLAVPWREDEEDFILSLLVYRGAITWQQLADATNAYFTDKPTTYSKTGHVVQRGQRTMHSLRQNPRLKEWMDLCARLDHQTDFQHPAIIIDWRKAYMESKAAEAVQHCDESREARGSEKRADGALPGSDENARLSARDSDQYTNETQLYGQSDINMAEDQGMKYVECV